MRLYKFTVTTDIAEDGTKLQETGLVMAESYLQALVLVHDTWIFIDIYLEDLGFEDIICMPDEVIDMLKKEGDA